MDQSNRTSETTVGDPIQEMLDKIQADTQGVHEPFYAWAQCDNDRIENEMPDTADHLIEGLRLVMDYGSKRVKTFADLKAALEIASQQNIAEKKQEIGAYIMHAEQELIQLSGTFDILAGRFWGMYPSRNEAGNTINTLPII
jgi:hypothetical protein